MFKSILRSAILSVSLMIGVAACSGATQEGNGSASVGELAQGAVDFGSHGPMKALGNSLAKVGLRADQRSKIEKLAVDVKAKQSAVHDARTKAHALLADQIEQGALDKVALEKAFEQVHTAMTDSMPSFKSTLTALHGILDAKQREILVDTMHESMKAHRKEWREHHEAKGGGKFAHHGKFGGPGRFAEAFDLTESQRELLRNTMMTEWKAAHGNGHGEGKAWHHQKGGFHGMKKHMKAVAEAFKSDKFNADELFPKHEMPAFKPHQRMIKMLETIMPTLSQEQRAKASLHFRKDHGPMPGAMHAPMAE